MKPGLFGRTSQTSQVIYNITAVIVLNGVQFFTVPIFTRLLGAEQYGLYTLYYTWISIIGAILFLQVGSTISVARVHFGPTVYPRYRSSALFLGLCSAGAWGVLMLPFIGPLERLTGFPGAIVGLMFVHACCQSVVGFGMGDLTFAKKAGIKFCLSLFLALATTGLGILLILYGPFEPYMARVWGSVGPYALVGAAFAIHCFRSGRTGYDRAFWAYCLPFAWPVIFHILSHDLLSQANRVMMDWFGVSMADIGVYGFIGAFSGIVGTVLGALNTSWVPFLFDGLKADDRVGLLRKTSHYVELFTVVGMGFLLLSREVCQWFAPSDFWGGIGYLPLLVCAEYFVFMYQFPVNFEFYHRRTGIIASCTAGAGVLNVLLNLYAIPHFGVAGAAASSMVAYFALFLIHDVIVRRCLGLDYFFTLRPFAVGLSALAVACGLFYACADMPLLRWGMGAALGVFELMRMYRRRAIF